MKFRKKRRRLIAATLCGCSFSIDMGARFPSVTVNAHYADGDELKEAARFARDLQRFAETWARDKRHRDAANTRAAKYRAAHARNAKQRRGA